MATPTIGSAGKLPSAPPSYWPTDVNGTFRGMRIKGSDEDKPGERSLPYPIPPKGPGGDVPPNSPRP